MAETGYGPGVGASQATGSTASPGTGLPLVDLRNLASYRGRQVQVGGLVSQVSGSVVSLDDGTASGRLIIQGEAAPYLDLIEVGDPIEVDGLVEADASGPYLLVTDPEGVIQTGDPGAIEPASPDPGAASASPGKSPGSPEPAAGGIGAGSAPVRHVQREHPERGLARSARVLAAGSVPPWPWLARRPSSGERAASRAGSQRSERGRRPGSVLKPTIDGVGRFGASP